ncbi:MAG TPA: hypothetical protein VH560_14435 [Polyangia bacterium]|jgi:hypothetical protein|nr:hypothetical protein [Polyangia bacterium]
MRFLAGVISAVTLSLMLVGCGGGASGGGHDGSVGSAGSTGSGGAAGTGGMSGSAGATATAGAGGTSGATGVAGSAGNGGAGGGTAGAGGNQAGAGGSSGAAGARATGGSDGGAPDQDAGPGVFTACDDHADFNGRGRCATTGKVGSVFALQNLTATGARTTLTAVFGTTNPPGDAACTQESIGGCVAYTCPRMTAAPTGGMAAGAITATSSGGVLITRPDATGAYDDVGLSRALWMTPKAALTFSAAGGAIAAFGETFCGPAGAMITNPAGAPGAGFTIDRANDLAFAWTGGAVGDLEIVFHDDTAAPAPTVDVRCFFTGASGQGTVPKAALAKIGAGAHGVASYLWVRKIGGASSGDCVELTGITTNASSTGAPFNGTATYQ